LIGSLLILRLFSSKPKKELLKILLLLQTLSILCFSLACLIPKAINYNQLFFLLFSLSQWINGFCCGSLTTIVTSFVPVLFSSRLQEVMSYMDASIICGMNLGLMLAGGLQIILQTYWLVYLLIATL
jgi:hypothetical protein